MNNAIHNPKDAWLGRSFSKCEPIGHDEDALVQAIARKHRKMWPLIFAFSCFSAFLGFVIGSRFPPPSVTHHREAKAYQDGYEIGSSETELRIHEEIRRAGR